MKSSFRSLLRAGSLLRCYGGITDTLKFFSNESTSSIVNQRINHSILHPCSLHLRSYCASSSIHFQNFSFRHEQIASDSFLLPSVQEIDAQTVDTVEKVIINDHWIFKAVDICQSIILSLHDFLANTISDQWWVTCIAAAFVVKFSTLPLILYQRSEMHRVAFVDQEIRAIAEFVRSVPGSKWEKLKTFRKLRKEALKNVNTSPVKLFGWGKILHIPIFLSTALGIRTIAISPEEYPALKEGGLWWFTDLTVADPHLILPIINAGVTLLLVELSMGSKFKPDQKLLKPLKGDEPILDIIRDPRVVDVIKTSFQGLTILFFPLISQFPAAVIIFWLSNTMIASVQNELISYFMPKPVINRSPEDVKSAVLEKVTNKLLTANKELQLVQTIISNLTKGELQQVNEELLNKVRDTIEKERESGNLTLPLKFSIRNDSETKQDYIAIELLKE